MSSLHWAWHDFGPPEPRRCDDCGHPIPATDVRPRCSCGDVYCDRIVCRACRALIIKNKNTRQRSVAVIIGWESDGDPWKTYGPTVDDMLAWLRDQGYAVWPMSWKALNDPEQNFAISPIVDADDSIYVNASGDTLHAALSAAVRAVAGISAPEDDDT